MKRYIKPNSQLVKFHSESLIAGSAPGDYVQPGGENEELDARRKEFGTSSSWD